jgi:uncharacterized Zn finger protein (UPF0148 family)
MFCPQCGSRTEVVETRGPFRDRRCKSNDCRREFTTLEQIMSSRRERVKQRDHSRLCARTRATQIKIYPLSPVVAAAGQAKSHPAPAPHPEAVVAEAQAKSRPAPAPLPELVQPPVVQQARLEFGSN